MRTEQRVIIKMVMKGNDAVPSSALALLKSFHVDIILSIGFPC